MGCTTSREASGGVDNNRETPTEPTSHRKASVAETAAKTVSNAAATITQGATQGASHMKSAVGTWLNPAFAQSPLRPVTNTVTKGGDHLRNIFAKPLQELLNYDTFKPVVHPKPEEERLFIQKALKENFVFETLTPRELSPLVDAFEKSTVQENEIIIQQGDVVGDYFYIVQKGTCQFLINEKPVGTCEAGASFGELALLYTTPRAATVQALNGSVALFRVDQKTFRYILKKQTEQGIEDKNNLLQEISFLKDMNQEARDKLLEVMQPKRFAMGEYLMRKGEKGDFFYILKEGKVKATNIGVGESRFEDVSLGPGDYFGERALITGEPRAANIVAQTDGMCFYIDKGTFETVLGKLNDLILRSQDKRLLSAMKIFVESELDDQTMSSVAKLVRDRAYQKGTNLSVQGREMPAALYLVRKGKIEIREEGSSNVKLIEPGAYFGDEQLLADRGAARRLGPAFIKPTYTAVVAEDCTVGILTLDNCRRVLDTPNLGHPPVRDSFTGEKFDPAKLKRHRILGAGTFGQVWLVSRLNSERKPLAYALKVQSKYELITDGQAQAVVYEKNVMSFLKHPFLIRLVNSYQDSTCVYMVMDLIQGGELYNVMHTAMRDGIPEGDARFYTAGIAEALGYMHNRGYIYRDLKPENVLVNDKGYPIIIDFGFAKYITGKTYTLCGTPLYLAPEVILNKGHEWGADHWSLGVMIFEMITGDQPFYEDGMQQMDLFRSIISGNFAIPRGSMSVEASSMIKGFLTRSPAKRLGNLAGGEEDIVNHKWFEKIDFELLKNQEIAAPFVPTIKDPLDSSNFEDWSHLKDKSRTKFPKLTPQQEKIFKDF